jgi:hypothetical protein
VAECATIRALGTNIHEPSKPRTHITLLVWCGVVWVASKDFVMHASMMEFLKKTWQIASRWCFDKARCCPAANSTHMEQLYFPPNIVVMAWAVRQPTILRSSMTGPSRCLYWGQHPYSEPFRSQQWAQHPYTMKPRKEPLPALSQDRVTVWQTFSCVMRNTHTYLDISKHTYIYIYIYIYVYTYICI